MTNKLPQGETLILAISSSDVGFDEVNFEGIIFRKNQSVKFRKSDCINGAAGQYKYQLPGSVTALWAPGVWEVELEFITSTSNRIRRMMCFEVTSTKITK